MKRHVLSAVIASCMTIGLMACGRDQAPVEEAAEPAEESRVREQVVEGAKDGSERVGEAATATEDAAASAADQAEEMRNRAEDDAEQMIGQVKSFLAEDKSDLARDLMAKLTATKDSLSETLRARIERLEAMFPDA